MKAGLRSVSNIVRRTMSQTKLTFNCNLTSKDVEDVPCIVIGLGKNLVKLNYGDLEPKIQSRVSQETWDMVMEKANAKGSEVAYLYSNKVVVARLPEKCSRHNAPSRSHAITKLVKKLDLGKSGDVVIVCDYKDVYPSGCAVVRAFPTYSCKTSIGLHEESNQGRKDPINISVEFFCSDGHQLTAGDLTTLEDSKHGIQLAARIVDTPCNFMHTDGFIEEIKEVGKALNIEPLVIRGKDLDNKGFGGIYGVGKGALHEPALAVLSHVPGEASKTIAWVGKGIVYDSGGLSIKGKTAMPGMKRDCGGAAGILGAFHAAVKQGFKQNLHAVFCLAENAICDRSTRPDDIHTLYSGKTVEINNTDAEGRLVVSDGVVYARKDLKADVIVDMCTLTGAQGISTGQYHAAHLTNDECWEGLASFAGRSSGDLSFPLVYCPELHFPEFASAVADMKNSVADRNNAQASCAGLFINAHLGFDWPGVWLHFDMAYPVHAGERATGYGVALLNTLFGDHVKSEMLNRISPTNCVKNDR